MKYYKKKCKNPKCGKEFMGTQTQQYCCPECRKVPDHHTYKSLKSELKENSKPKKKKKIATIDEIAVKARKLGMTYGKYMEMLYKQGRMI